MGRRHISTRERLRLFNLHGGICHICGGKIDGTRDAWEVEHVIPLAMGGSDDDGNRYLAHRKCHAPKTAEDFGHLAKAKRREAKHIGAKARPRNIIAGSKASKWRKRLDGTVERRE